MSSESGRSRTTLVNPSEFEFDQSVSAALRSQLDGSSLPTWYADSHGTLQYWNRAWRDFTGEVSVDDSLAPLVHPEDLPRFQAEFRLFLTTHSPFHTEFRLRHVDGNYRSLSATTIPQVSTDGVVTGSVTACVDITARLTAAQQDARSAKLLQQTGTVASIGAWELDLETMQTRWTSEVHRMHEIGLEKTMTLDEALQFCDLDARPELVEAIQRAIKSGTPFDLELPFVKLTGEPIWVRLIGKLERSEEKTTRLFGTFQDITDRKLAELELRNSQDRSRTYIEHFNDIVFTVTPDGEIRYIAPNTERHLGYTPAELIGTSFMPLVHPDDIATCFHYMLNLLETGTSRELECRVRHKNGNYHWFATTGAMLPPDPDGSVLLVGCTRDITERKKMQESLRNSEELFRIVTDSIDDIIGVANTERVMTYVSPSWYRATGYTEEEVAGTDFSVRVHSDDLAFVEEARNRNIQGEQTSIEWRCRHHDGHYIWLETRANPVRNSEGKVVSIVSCSRNITERKSVEEEIRRYAREIELSHNQITRQAAELRQANERAQQASLAKSEFLANMSHEIRTPMTAILGYANLLLTEDSWIQNPTQRNEALHAIRRNGDHLLTIINDILDLSKIEAGRMLLETTSFDVRQLVAEVVASLQFRAVERGLSLAADFTAGVPQLIATDPTRLRQVLMNLIGNAIKFTETGGVRIQVDQVSSTGAPPQLQVRVSDTGIGIDPTHLEELFLPFTQADARTSRKFGGTGLGLAISRRLSEMMGGQLTATSEPGRGSTFIATINCQSVQPTDDDSSKTSPALKAPASTVEPPSRKLLEGVQILLVEDGIDNQRLIAFLLQRAGAKVQIADNGQIALDLLEASDRDGPKIDLILMDMQMPVLDGYSTTKCLRQRDDKRPIIALTANAMTSDRQLCLDAGCDDYISKPVDRAILLDVVSRWSSQAANGN